MSDNKPRKSTQVSTTVSADVFDALENHRWTVRMKMTELVSAALSDYIVKNSIPVADSEPSVKGATGKP